MEHADFLKKMETYMGKDNPPSDFDEFWNNWFFSLLYILYFTNK